LSTQADGRSSEALDSEILGSEGPGALAGHSPAILRARERVAALAPLMAPVLLLGERGSGRRCVAAQLHRDGPLRNEPFVTLRCSQIRPGALPATGIIHLEEIEQIAAPQQARLRELLEPLWQPGADTRIRILTSSGLRLTSLRSAGASFDAHLTRRLGRFEVRLPPRRERLEDIPALTRVLLGGISERLGRRAECLDEEALDALAAHTWPGNLVEFEQVLEELIAYSAEGRPTRRSVDALLAERASPLATIAAEHLRAERAELLALYREHGSFAGVARALGLSRNAARYRFAKHGLLPRSGQGRV
jgi:DNA-binding NtrC family response regulator